MTTLTNATNSNLNADKPNNTSLSLKQRLAMRDKQPVLLLDTSYSMTEDCEPGCSRITALRNIVANLTTSPKIYWFNDTCGPCLRDAIPTPCGGTWLHRALEVMLDKKINNILLLTDGEAQDKERVLSLLATHPELKIQVMYIGPGDTPEFLNKVATGGMATKENIADQQLLTDKLTLLLDSGSSSIQL